MSDNSYSLKDDLFNKRTLRILTSSIKNHYNEFNQEAYEEEILGAFKTMALKERSLFMSKRLKVYLPDDYIKATEILLSASSIQKESMFVFSAFTDFVMLYGCNENDVDYSLTVLGELTKVFSAEFAIRPFINRFPEKTHKIMLLWAKSNHPDQRRLASEGLRQKLPWAESITIDYKKGAEPLSYLFMDSERYVTRSVANHLNDLSKIDPEFVLDLLKVWKASGKQTKKEMTYIINHALRTLIKRGHIETLEWLGYKKNPAIHVSPIFIEEKHICLGDYLKFEFDIEFKEAAMLMIDYVITYPMARSKQSTKVFKIKKYSGEMNQNIHISKEHLFKQMTTKKLYAGEYSIQLQINGKQFCKERFHIELL